MKNISAIILCAGRSSRTQGEVKPLLKWKSGQTFLERTYKTLLEAQASTSMLNEIIFVTGYRATHLQLEIQKLQAKFVFNPYFERGMHSSICEGLKALTPGWDGAMIALVDQPQLEVEDYALLVRSFCESNLNLARPEYNGQFGNPGIIGKRYFLEVLGESDIDRGCSYLFQRHPEDVYNIKMPNDRCILDVDTPDDLLRMC